MSKYDDRRSPIMPEEISAKLASLHEGDIVNLPVMQYNDDLTEAGYKVERCTVDMVSRYLVVFRRPNGMRESRMLVELCQIERRSI